MSSPHTRPPRLTRRDRGTTRHRRGVAMIMVLTAVAIFTAVVIDFSYSSRVELDLAANARDEVRAYFLARSAVNLSRLVLHFQQQLDTSPLASGGGGLASLLGGAGGAGGAGGLASLLGGAGASGAGTSGLGGLPAGAMPGAGGGGLNLRLYELIPIDSGMIQMFLGGAGISSDLDADGNPKPLDGSSSSSRSGASAHGSPTPTASRSSLTLSSDANPALPVVGKGKGITKAFGDFSGSFHAEVEDESKKFNIAWLDSLARMEQMAITRGLLMFADKRYEWLYDEDDARGQRTTAKDIVINMHDYIDADQVASTLNPVDAVAPFAPGFSDETQPYTRYKPTYKPKNAPMDSVDELYMVDGVGDHFMAAFRNRLTVFPDKNKAINVNTDDPFMQLMNIYAVAANPNDPMLANPLVIQEVLRDLQLAKMFPGMGISVQQFLAIITANKIAVNPAVTANVQGNIQISDKTDTFTIHAVGEVGKVQKKLTAVVKYDSGLGKLLYWKEE